VSNVFSIGTTHVPVNERRVDDFPYDDYCVLLEAGTAQSHTEINGMTILQYPRAIIICHGDKCTSITQTGTDMDAYIAACLAELDHKTVAA
jgi:hypothetical protein